MEELKTKVLLAEASNDAREYWSNVLSEIHDSDIEFLRFTNKNEIDESIHDWIPDIVVLDLTMAGDRGREEFLNLYKSNSDIPFIVIVGAENHELSIQAVQAGARDCLIKITDDVSAMSRSLRTSIWNQTHLKMLRSIMGIDQLTDLNNRKKLLFQVEQKLKQASKTRQMQLLKLRKALLEEAEIRITIDPYDIEAYFYKARILRELDRIEESQLAFQEILNRGPKVLGPKRATESIYFKAYAEAVYRHPDDPDGHLVLAGLMRENENFKSALAEYEHVLKLIPNHPNATIEKENLLQLIGKKSELALRQIEIQRVADNSKIKSNAKPIPTILLSTLSDCNAPFKRFLDEKTFQVTEIICEFCDPNYVLPPHKLFVNAIGDADMGASALTKAEAIVASSQSPVINYPSLVKVTSRLENANRLSKINNVITPRIIELPRDLLSKSAWQEVASNYGFSFPFLLRAPGFHTGRYFQLVSNENELLAAVKSMPGNTLLMIQYLETVELDGSLRKYRVMMIDGKLYPAHLAISHQWKIHYFSSDMFDNADFRKEEAEFLRNMERTLGPKAFNALGDICKELALDYAGADFGLDKEGNLVLFEADATMNIPPLGSDPRWDYRRPYVSNIMEAARKMLLDRALAARG